MGRFAACGRKGRSCKSTCLVLPPEYPTVGAEPRGCLRVPGDLRVPSSPRSRRSADGPSAALSDRISELAEKGWVCPFSYPLPVQKAANSRAAVCWVVGVVMGRKLY